MEEFILLNDYRTLYIPDDVSIEDYYLSPLRKLSPLKSINFNFENRKLLSGNLTLNVQNNITNYKVNNEEINGDCAWRIDYNTGEKFLIFHPEKGYLYIVLYDTNYEVR